MKIDGIAAIVTGGASGLGAATATRLAAGGAKVAIFDLNEELGRETAARIGGSYHKTNVTSDEGVAASIAEAEAANGEGWDQDNPAFRQMFTSLFLPDSSAEEQRWFTEVQRTTTSAENAAAIQRAGAGTDVAALLPRIAVPALVAHCRDDAMVPFEAGRALARAIPGARFLALEGRNHVLLATEPAWKRFAETMRAFLDD